MGFAQNGALTPSDQEEDASVGAQSSLHPEYSVGDLGIPGGTSIEPESGYPSLPCLASICVLFPHLMHFTCKLFFICVYFMF